MSVQMVRLEGRETGKYWTRVDRSLCWLGDKDDEQKQRQEVLAGVAGCGGIGGALAVRLARLGVRHIKVADPDTFDWTNINRQMGATQDTVGQNKARWSATSPMIWREMSPSTFSRKALREKQRRNLRPGVISFWTKWTSISLTSAMPSTMRSGPTHLRKISCPPGVLVGHLCIQMGTSWYRDSGLLRPGRRYPHGAGHDPIPDDALHSPNAPLPLTRDN